jgi:hypothetical protein
MRLFKQEAEPETEMIPVNFAAAIMDAIGTPAGVPEADAWLGEYPEWGPADELPPAAPSVEELLTDPDVAVVVEAAGKGACHFAYRGD